MSRSIHVTIKDLKGLTKEELNKQAEDVDSDLNQLRKKSKIKREVKKSRKNKT